MINFSIGPVQMDNETRLIGKEQIPYFRTSEFSEMMKINENLLCKFFDAPLNSRTVFLTGSGTASMEASVCNFFTENDKVLIVNGGSFGQRFVDICSVHNIDYTEIKLNYGKPLTEEHLSKFKGSNYTGFLVQLCETSTGVLYNMDLIGKYCKENNLFLLVDAVSGFIADKISMKNMNINAAITGSQKALGLPPGMSFTVLDPKAIERCKIIDINNLYFNFPNYLKDGERGQTPFTPAVSILIQLNEKLKRIEFNGGITTYSKIISDRAQYFRNKIRDLPFKMFTEPDYSSNSLTAVYPNNPKVNAYDIFNILRSDYNITVCPNAGELAEKVFRVGHIGDIKDIEIDTLINALSDLKSKNLV